MDILKHGGQVEVLQPPALRKRVAREARAIAAQYR
jgi:predicted DNA-binding transcriptional regulator YafY